MRWSSLANSSRSTWGRRIDRSISAISIEARVVQRLRTSLRTLRTEPGAMAALGGMSPS